MVMANNEIDGNKKYTSNAGNFNCHADAAVQCGKIIALWWHPAASREALDFLYQAMCTALCQRIAMVLEQPAKKVGFLTPKLMTIAFAGRIALAHLYGHLKGLQRSCIFLHHRFSV